MKQKKYFILAAAALLMAACSENDVVEKQSPQVTGEDEAINFDVYVNRSTTRAGWAGEATSTGLRSTTELGASGFGVFGYYTDNSSYDQQCIPNFMYNQQVNWDGSANAFTYNPVKYWPNEYGSSAISDDQDRVTFFAYAPYVNVDVSTGKALSTKANPTPEDHAEAQKWGINSLTRNTANGDPLVKYLVAFDPTHSVDLCWGVASGENWQKVEGGTTQTMTAGLPWVDVYRPGTTTQKLKFNFLHALSKLNVQIDVDPDITTHDETSALNASETKVYVRSITFEGLAIKGALNLNNTDAGASTAYWMDYNGTNDLVTGEEVVIYDGRKDGKEGTAGGEATNEKFLGLNPNLIQSTMWNDPAAKTGVTEVPSNLFRKWDGSAYVAAGVAEPVYVIPTGDAVKVTIVYDVETADGNLSTYLSDGAQTGSSIENRITKSITFRNDVSAPVTKFECGKAYTLKLHLGMNSVKFDASVTPWEDANNGNNVWLPSNVTAYAASSPSATAAAATLDASEQTYNFAITGLTPGEAVTNGGVSTPLTAPSANQADASGVAYQSVTIAANNSVKDRTCTAVTWTGSTSSKAVALTITQKAHALGLGVSSVTANTIVLSSLATELTGAKWNDASEGVDQANLASNSNVIVKRNGVSLAYTSGTPDATQFSFDKGTITLAAGQVQVGDVITITVKAGDAPAETYVAHIGGLSYDPAVATVGVAAGTYTVPEATLIGYGTIAYAKTTVSDDVVSSFNPSTRVATLSGTNTGNVVFTATLTPASTDGWHYLATNPTATFTLTVE